MQHLPRQDAPNDPDTSTTSATSSSTLISNISITSLTNTTVPSVTSGAATSVNSTIPAITTTPIQTPPSSTPDPTSTVLPPQTNLSVQASQTVVIVHNDSATLAPLTSADLFSGNSSLLPTATGNLTENISTVVSTQTDGRVTSFITHLPTNLAESKPGLSSSKRSGIIAGATAAFVILLCIILAVVFAYRKHKLHKDLASYEKKREGKGLLDGEDFDDYFDTMRSSTRSRGPIIPDMSSTSSLHAPHKSSDTGRQSMLRTRVSESGSIFREEIWPPPALVDPIKERSSQVDLSNIVSGVMGPNADTNSDSNASVSRRHITDHYRTMSTSGSPEPFSFDRNSTGTATNLPAPVLRVANGATNSIISDSEPWNDPFDSQPPSINYLPPGALRPSTPGAHSHS